MGIDLTKLILVESVVLSVLVLISVLLLRKNKVFKKRRNKMIKIKIKRPKTEQVVVFMIYLFVFSVAGYFLFANLFPENSLNTSGVYSLSAGDSFLTSKLKSLYLKEDKVLGKENEEGLRMIISEEPMRFVFNPKKIISPNSTAEIELSLVGTGTDVYLNDKLIIPDLRNYEMVRDFDNESVWIRRNLVSQGNDSGEPENYENGTNAEDFIYENFPQASVYSFTGLSGGMPILQDYEPTTTRINTTFRDNLKLAVYAEGNLEIEFTKQDLNWYIGKDEYNITIKDYSGEVVFSEVYEDDGIKKTGDRGEEQDFEIKLNNLTEGIYYIDFIKDKNNKHTDITIKDIEINSNKVLILERALPLEEFDFYTEVFSSKTIGFNYWHNGKDQEISISGTETRIIDLNESWKSKKYEEILTKGEYNFEIPKGDVWVYCDIFSLTENGWFDLPISSEKKLLNSDIIIIDENKLKIDGNNYLYKGIIEIKEKQEIKLQVLDKFRFYFKEIKLSLN